MKFFLKIFFIGLFFLTNSIADAKFCIGCGHELSDNANFCTRCMAPQPKMTKLPAVNRPRFDMREHILEMFEFVDDFEGSFHDVQYLNILGKMPEIRTKFQNATVKYRQIENDLDEELKILANLYATKYQLLEGINGVMKNLRLDSGYKDAVLKASMVAIGLRNKIIDEFRKPVNFNYDELNELKKRVVNISHRTNKYEVTSKYLTIGDEKAVKGDSVMVLGITKGRAHVLLMAPTLNYKAVDGIVKLNELEKRTNWKKEYEFYFID